MYKVIDKLDALDRDDVPTDRSMISTEGIARPGYNLSVESASRSASAPNVRTDVIDDYIRFESLRDEWEELLEDSDQSTFFLRWDWARLWWQKCSPVSSRLLIITCRDDIGNLVGLAPLYWRCRSMALIPGIREILFIGTGTAIKSSEYTDIIARRGYERQVAHAMAAALAGRRDWDRLRLDELPENSRVLRLMGEAIGPGLQVRTSGRTHYIRTATTSQDFVQNLGRSSRHSLARRTRQLFTRHHCEFIQIQAAEALEGGLDDLVRLHQARWNSIGEPGSFALPGFDEFLKEAARFCLDKGLLRLWMLKVNSRPAAVVLAFFYNGVAHYFQGGFDPAYSKNSIGTVMLGLCIEACIADPDVSEFDFMGGNDPYKDRWTRDRREIYSAVWMRPSGRSLAFAIQERAIETAKAVVRPALPSWLRTGLSRCLAKIQAAASANSKGAHQKQDSGERYSRKSARLAASASHSSPPDRGLHASVLDDQNAIASLKGEWDELLDQSGQGAFFLRWQWTWDWWMTYAPAGSKPFLIACRDAEGRLAGLAPLYCRQRRTLGILHVRELVFIGTGIHMRSSEYLDIVARQGCEEEVCAAMIRALNARQDWDRLSLLEMTVSSRTGMLLARLLGPNARVAISGRSHYIDTSVGWDAFRMELGRSTRDNLARYTRRLFTKHACRFSRVASLEDLEPAMDALVRLHQARWQERGHRGSFALPHFEEFLRKSAAGSLEDGSLRLWSLEVDSRIAAVLVGFAHNGVIHAFQAGFDPVYSRDSLGTVMLGLCIKASTEEPGVKEFDFMGGDDLYKDRWTRKRRDLLSLTFEKSNARIHVLAVQEHSKETALRLLRALTPAPIRAAARRRLSAH